MTVNIRPIYKSRTPMFDYYPQGSLTEFKVKLNMSEVRWLHTLDGLVYDMNRYDDHHVWRFINDCISVGILEINDKRMYLTEEGKEYVALNMSFNKL